MLFGGHRRPLDRVDLCGQLVAILRLCRVSMLEGLW